VPSLRRLFPFSYPGGYLKKDLFGLGTNTITTPALAMRAFNMNSNGLKQIIRSVTPRSLRNWLRSPAKSLTWLWDSGSFALGSRKILDLRPDWRLVCHPSAYRVTVQAQVEDPEQAPEFQNFLSHCTQGMSLFDVGAHFGIFSLAAARFGGTALAVDPSLEALRMVNVQATLNNWSDRIRTIRAAASDNSGGIDMLAAGVFSDYYFMVSEGRNQSELTHLDTVTVDELSLKFGPPSHLKIDVEGYEAAVLRGARATLKNSAPLLFLELHNEIVASNGGDQNAALNELSNLGYQVFGLDGEPASREVIFRKAITRVVARAGHRESLG
jgi:FkbM family methyltransferase